MLVNANGQAEGMVILMGNSGLNVVCVLGSDERTGQYERRVQDVGGRGPDSAASCCRV